MDVKLISNRAENLLPLTNRTTGKGIVHVSEVIHCMCLDLGMYNDRVNRASTNQMELGLCLEHAIAHRYSLEYPGDYVQPGEQSEDGIYLTPDLLYLPLNRMEEIKLTWMSSRHDILSDKFWRYWVQLQAYAYVFGSEVGRLHICHVRGNYNKDEEVVDYNIWEARFSEGELKENWNMIKRYVPETLSRRGERYNG